MAKPKILHVNKFIVDGKVLKEWLGKRIPKWMKHMQNLKGGKNPNRRNPARRKRIVAIIKELTDKYHITRLSIKYFVQQNFTDWDGAVSYAKYLVKQGWQ